MYEQNQNVQDTMLIGKDKKYLIMKDINDNSYNLYWIRKGSPSVYSEIEEENVGKDGIELSVYITIFLYILQNFHKIVYHYKIYN